jgi:hypothetical protein
MTQLSLRVSRSCMIGLTPVLLLQRFSYPGFPLLPWSKSYGQLRKSMISSFEQSTHGKTVEYLATTPCRCFLILATKDWLWLGCVIDTISSPPHFKDLLIVLVHHGAPDCWCQGNGYDRYDGVFLSLTYFRLTRPSQSIVVDNLSWQPSGMASKSRVRS